jgi:hypothetical protein
MQPLTPSSSFVYAEGVGIISAQGNTLGNEHTTVPTLKGLNTILPMGSIISPLQGDESIGASFTQGVTLGWNYSTPLA